MNTGWFVSGTDTGIGKTLFSAALIQGLAQQGYRVAGMKPVASGCEETNKGLRNEDALQLMQAANVKLGYEQVNPFAFAPAIAPHIAAQQAQVRIDPRRIAEIAGRIQQQVDLLVVEGVGGWEVPLNRDETVADLAVTLGMPVILVVGIRLGCINHAILTADAIRRRGLALAGWVANMLDPQMMAAEENIQTLQGRLPAPMLCRIPYNPENDLELIATAIDFNEILTTKNSPKQG